MKSLEITTNKRLLIVEPPKNYSLVHFKYGDTRLGFVNLDKANPYDDVIDFTIGKHLHTICRGSDLNEEIAAGMVDSKLSGTVLGEIITKIKGQRITVFKNYKNGQWTYTALDSFISVIEAQGWYWGENPLTYVKTPAEEIADKNKWVRFMSKEECKFLNAESRTFHPERVLIFEIVEG
ncbi:hypothetical protein FY557_17330 [Chryseobacterium sp. SN22]|uniref:hypothetical protein n=1 Tax=Chryseobacterium sp. SN22 TaxID=2606431 RepID=UPI0011EDEED3|nr:hypothetical protein [Chryseobacterium sp. SN22]KAA0126413.1 hypothetical protein FY557_17330 [Chryseobacterium sp. SN22]